MNSTIRSLAFWMVLVVVGVLVWQFSTKYQASAKLLSFSEFMASVDAGQVERVTITGNDINGVTKTLGGLEYANPLKGDGQQATTVISAARQRAAMQQLLAALDPKELAIPDTVLTLFPPRLERDVELVAVGRDAVGMSIGIPKRQSDKPTGPKDELDLLVDDFAA